MKKGYLPVSGQFVDRFWVPAPKQRNTDAEKEAIKAGKSTEEIGPDAPNNARRKDVNARIAAHACNRLAASGWTLKIGGKVWCRPNSTPLPQIALPVLGCKSHIRIDRRSGFIFVSTVTSTADAGGRMLDHIVRKETTSSDVWVPFRANAAQGPAG